jgi:hypothetical protein
MDFLGRSGGESGQRRSKMMKRFCLIILLTILSFIFLTSVSGAEPVAAKKKAVEVKTPVAPKIRESEVAALLAKGAERQSAGEREVALHYYRQAAAAGNSEGAYRAGTLAWETSPQIEGRARLLKLDAGLRSFFQAATNRHAAACVKLSQAYRDGLGVGTNFTRAYTWLIIAKQFDAKTPTDLLDQLVVALDPTAVQQAQDEARRWLAGAWPEQIAPEIVLGDSRFKINGLTGGAMPIVVVNSRTLGVGDSASVPPLAATTTKPALKTQVAQVDITCLSIGRDYVLLRVAKEKPVVLLPLTVY